MKIGLVNLEPKIVNTALMQISQYHKQRGDTVGWWSPLEHRQFDYVYCSSLFDFTDKSYIPESVITGGTGYDLDSRLSKAIEDCDYYYTLYPECDYSIVWFSRGCNNKCPFCVVPQKEGRIHAVKPKPLNPNGKYICVQDNSFFDNPEWEKAVEYLRSTGQRVDITNINVRTLTEDHCKALATLKLHDRIKIAWDNPKQDLLPQIHELIKHIKPYRIMCYVLIGYWSTPEQDLFRVMKLKELGINPMAMPYDKSDDYQSQFTRWCNNKFIFTSTSWENYKWQSKRKRA